MRAATNLGELTRMSARVDQLATDLANSARTAEPQVTGHCVRLTAQAWT